MPNEEDYNKEYYQRNKEKIREGRKQRYRKDPKYRRSIRTRTKAKHDALRNWRDATGYDRRVITDGKNKYISIGKLGDLITRSVHTIRSYHKTGVIPDTGVCDSRGWRLYTLEQASICKEVFKRFDRGELTNLDEVSHEIEKKWRNDDAKEK